MSSVSGQLARQVTTTVLRQAARTAVEAATAIDQNRHKSPGGTYKRPSEPYYKSVTPQAEKSPTQTLNQTGC